MQRPAGNVHPTPLTLLRVAQRMFNVLGMTCERSESG
jgi:hypothetical protein